MVLWCYVCSELEAGRQLLNDVIEEVSKPYSAMEFATSLSQIVAMPTSAAGQSRGGNGTLVLLCIMYGGGSTDIYHTS